MDIDVTLTDADWQTDFPDVETRLAAVLQTAAMHLADAVPAHASLALVLSNDANVRQLNREYRGKDTATNVLSFPVPQSAVPDRHGAEIPLGDVILARETVVREAAEQGKGILDHACHLAVHGFLHLLGHDHQTDEEATLMEALEITILGKVSISDPYALALET